MHKFQRSIVLPAFALALSTLAFQASAQGGPASSTPSGSASSNAEVRRGVPGVDVDVNTRDRGPNNGVPGVDVDVRGNTRNNAGDRDTAAGRMGAGPLDPRSADARGMRADRN